MKKLPLLCASILSAAFLLGAQANAQDKSVNEKLVDTFVALSGGPHEGRRVNHAEGILATGEFMPSDTAKAVTKAAHLQSDKSRVIVRFSNATGVPDIDDASPQALPKGMAVRFLLPEDEVTDMVLLSVNRFPVSTPEQFLQLLQAIKATQSSEASPSPIESFLADTPSAKRFVELDKPAPVSFATQNYHGINAFKFENADGDTVYGRYLVDPMAGQAFLSEEERASAGADYLMAELQERLEKHSIKFTISLQIASEEDEKTDPTVVWPDDRQIVELGTLSIDALMADGEAYARANMFNPLALPEGITASQDPVLLARPGAYAISFGKRAQ